jgi:hypothetical protein
MPATSLILLPSSSHTSEPGVETVTGEKIKGAGFYGLADGLHTVQIQITGFIGDIAIQGTLSSDPANSDWVNIPLVRQGRYRVDTTGLVSAAVSIGPIVYTSATTSITIYNFTGNFVWIRAIVYNWTVGSVNRIILNY